MTAKEIIDELSKYDPDTEVRCVLSRENPFDSYEDTKEIFALKTSAAEFVYISHC